MNKVLKETVFKDCPIRNVLARISDKWSMLVIYTLNRQQGVDGMRFSTLRRCIPDISQKMLTSTLRTLEQDGYVSRKVYAEVPPRVEYRLTDRSLSLLPLLESLIEWAQNNMAAILTDRNASKEAEN